jgi:hypothetical protein
MLATAVTPRSLVSAAEFLAGVFPYQFTEGTVAELQLCK